MLVSVNFIQVLIQIVRFAFEQGSLISCAVCRYSSICKLHIYLQHMLLQLVTVRGTPFCRFKIYSQYLSKLYNLLNKEKTNENTL